MSGPRPLDKAGRSIRPVSAGDAPWLAACHAQVFDPAWSLQSFMDLLHLPTTWGWAVYEESQPLGFILMQVQKDEAEILTFLILPEGRGQGLGRGLLRHALDQTPGRPVYLEVAQSRQIAYDLYTSLGFVLSGRRRAYYRSESGAEDALCLTLTRNKTP